MSKGAMANTLKNGMSILNELERTSNYMSSQEIANIIGVKSKQVQRYITALCELGVSVENKTGPGGGYRLVSNAFLRQINLTDVETTALLRGVDYLKQNDLFIFNKDLENAKNKIFVAANRKEDGSKESIGYVNKGNKYGEKIIDNYGVINQAIKKNKKISITYRSLKGELSTNRVIYPYELIVYGGEWHVISYCELRGDVRDFKLVRFEKIEIMEECFARSINIKEYIGKRSVFKDQHFVELEIKAPFSFIVNEKIWSDHQETKWIDSQILHFRAEMEGLNEIVNWILGMGDCVKVIGSETVFDLVQDKVQKMYNNIKNL